MNSDMLVTREIAEILVKLCFDITEFSRHYDTDSPDSARNFFACNEQVKIGFQWFIGAGSTPEMTQGIHAYRCMVEKVLKVYEGIGVPIDNKKELVRALGNLYRHLHQLEQEVNAQMK